MDSWASDSSDSDSSNFSEDDSEEEIPFAERAPVRSIFFTLIYHARFVLKLKVPQMMIIWMGNNGCTPTNAHIQHKHC